MAKIVKCKTCGAQIAKTAKVCPKCGAKSKKKTPWFAWLIGFFLLCSLLGGIAQHSANKPQSEQSKPPINSSAVKDSSPSPDEILAFDERSWSDFKRLYTAHNNLMDAMQKYTDGAASAVSFYDYCEEAEKYFANASLSFFYGEKDYQETYLSAFQSMALSDQMAAKSIMKYLDSFKASDLSEAQNNIEKATDAIAMIAANRGNLLVMAGLSDEEIHARVEADTADLS